jgi:hypothetical protein
MLLFVESSEPIPNEASPLVAIEPELIMLLFAVPSSLIPIPVEPLVVIEPELLMLWLLDEVA